MNGPPPEDPNPFLPAYGKASLLLSLFAIGVLWMGGSMFEHLKQTMIENAPTGSGPSLTPLYLQMGAYALAVVSAAAAAVFGFLSLLGYGKIDGSSRRVSGFVGMVLGAFIAASPLLLLPAANAARRAAQSNTTQNQIDQLAIHRSWLPCAEGAVVLRKPGREWKLIEKESTPKVSPIASLLTMRTVPGTGAIVGMLIEEPVTLEELNISDREAIDERLVVLAKEMVAEHAFKKVSEIRFDSGRMGSTPYAEFALEGDDENGERFGVQNRLFYVNNHLMQAVAVAPVDYPGRTDDWAAPFFRAVEIKEVDATADVLGATAETSPSR